MLPISNVFSRFPRLVHELSAAPGQAGRAEARLARRTELDAGLIEKISDPLTHLVRNAIDHGLETPDGAARSGQAAHGHVCAGRQRSAAATS